VIGDIVVVLPGIADGNAFSISLAAILVQASRVTGSSIFDLSMDNFVAPSGNETVPDLNCTTILPGTTRV
jgi:hypothetical protein